MFQFHEEHLVVKLFQAVSVIVSATDFTVAPRSVAYFDYLLVLLSYIFEQQFDKQFKSSFHYNRTASVPSYPH